MWEPKLSGSSLGAVVDGQRERMRALPLDGGSTEDRRKFLTANPTSCSLGSLGSLLPLPSTH